MGPRSGPWVNCLEFNAMKTAALQTTSRVGRSDGRADGRFEDQSQAKEIKLSNIV
jgi:hypothetical protein